jgi:AcrR family transcriptional regulator
VDEGLSSGVRRLPAGPHGLPPELVERNQRERLVAAMAEVCGERGYAECAVAEVAKRAGVSTASFYRHFADKRECMLASFEELFGRLLEGVGAACAGESDGGDRARAAAGAAARMLAGDAPAARLLTIEIVAVGSEGVLAQHAAIERLASLLRGEGEPREPGDGARNGGPDVTWGRVAAIVALIARRVAEGRELEPAEVEALAAPSNRTA